MGEGRRRHHEVDGQGRHARRRPGPRRSRHGGQLRRELERPAVANAMITED
jgi:hypothetical protein